MISIIRKLIESGVGTYSQETSNEKIIGVFNKSIIGSRDIDFENTNPFFEILIDRFFDFLNSVLLSIDQKNTEDLEAKIAEFCNKNNISIHFENSDELSGDLINHRQIIIRCNPNIHSNKQILYLILHELSHYITNTSSNNKLKKFMNYPNKYYVSKDDVSSLEKELNYILSPAEISNWAFELSLKVYKLSKLMPNELYVEIRNDVKNINDILKSSIYNRIHDDLKPLVQIIFYVYRLKNLSESKKTYKVHMNRLNHLINLMGKYVKRLKKIF